ncbi:hypothetical protein [Bradyrhizobium japonicum]|uniref:hypothetical protein n=1 Tax=Bradyrhizobium japonicum TaxID=375 RepID=UPI0012FE6E4F|nr:hypothetical protein [Bradyrhizobium japonicum]
MVLFSALRVRDSGAGKNSFDVVEPVGRNAHCVATRTPLSKTMKTSLVLFARLPSKLLSIGERSLEKPRDNGLSGGNNKN